MPIADDTWSKVTRGDSQTSWGVRLKVAADRGLGGCPAAYYQATRVAKSAASDRGMVAVYVWCRRAWGESDRLPRARVISICVIRRRTCCSGQGERRERSAVWAFGSPRIEQQPSVYVAIKVAKWIGDTRRRCRH